MGIYPHVLLYLKVVVLDMILTEVSYLGEEDSVTSPKNVILVPSPSRLEILLETLGTRSPETTRFHITVTGP